MRTLSETAQADIVKLTGGKPWCEVIDITLPEDFSPSATELTFLSKDPDDIYHILITNSIMESRLAIAAPGWATQGLTADYKWYFGVPYQRDPIEDSSEKKGAVNSRIMLGDTGGTIKAIVDKADGFIGLNVSIGFAMVNTASAFTVSTGFLECYEPDVTYDWQIKTTTHDKTYFSCTLFIDSPIEWKFPPRTMFKNVCHFAFKGTECGFDGSFVRPVKPKRGADIIGKSIYPGGWLISGGYVEQLNLTNGSLTTVSMNDITDNDYEFIAAVDGVSFYGKRAGSDYAIWFLYPLNPIEISGSVYYKLINTTEYPIENTLTSGATADAYAITYSATTRRLYRFSSGTTVTRVGTEQYYNVVSSAAAGSAFAIQGGTYSGGTFTPSNQTTGRLVRIDGVAQTSISEDISWKWVRAMVNKSISPTLYELYAIDSNDKLWYWNATAGLFPVYEDPSIPVPVQIVVNSTRNRLNFSHNGYLAYLIDYVSEEHPAVLRVISGNAQVYYNDEYEWNSIYTDDYINAYAFYGNGLALIEGDKTGSDFVVNHITNKAIGFITDVLPILNVNSVSGVGTINPKSPRFYYVSGGNLYLYEYKPYATCNHRLSDCLLRGNQERFGGYPGIGSGGLIK